MKDALLVIQMIPAIIEAVRKLEDVFPEGGKGKEKLALLKEMLSAAYDGLSNIWPAIETIVAAFVKFANTVGLFKKTA